ncbi:hypothetical protein [Marinomonas sp. S3726]|uniref:hypothetical protein n=1 Tax=Marinomonas sp. S3726 TaxID=579484 RepID=UPI0012F62B12|nr:hypothetical protein [Marinomonas sp. S3726]
MLSELTFPLLICISAIVFFIGVLGIWSYFAPTSGAIIASGEVRPNTSKGFEVIAQLNPLDIDQVKIGSSVRLSFSSYSFKKQIPIERKIQFISKDTEFNPRSNKFHYTVKIPIESKKIIIENPVIKLRAGLPVEVFIQTKKRTLFEYLMDSIINLKEKGMRE